MISHTFREKFVQLALDSLIFSSGQKLVIKAEPILHDVVAAVAEEAYARGAVYVDYFSSHAALTRARATASRGESLDYVPRFYSAFYDEIADGSWSLLSIHAPENPHELENLSADRLGRISRAHAEITEEWSRAVGRNEFPWLVMTYPTPVWADAVFPVAANAEHKMEALFAAIYRFDLSDPSAFWWNHAEALLKRADYLTSLNIRELHFQDDGTDLTISLSGDRVWLGGRSTTGDGIHFLPNLPTDEVFTTPVAPETSGRVATTRPATVLGRIVEGAWFQFSEGKVVDFGATKGRDALENFLEVDSGSRRVGEIALVDSGSPLAKTNCVFFNTLLDENAASHLALGSGYPEGVYEGAKIGEEQLTERGVNRSVQHNDFMIGSSTGRVWAKNSRGEENTLVVGGRFVWNG